MKYLIKILKLIKKICQKKIPSVSIKHFFQQYYHGKIKRVPFSELYPNSHNIHIELYAPFTRTPGTSITLYELSCILTIIKYRKMTKILEIGTYDGNTTLNIAANIPLKGKIYTLDFPLDFEEGKKSESDSKWDRTPSSLVGKQFRDSLFEDKIIQVYGDSTKIDWTKMGTDFDLIFLDGNHDANYVEKDTLNALKVLGKGGCIIWHDYGFLYGVSKVVDKFSKSMDIKAVADTRLAIAEISQ